MSGRKKAKAYAEELMKEWYGEDYGTAVQA